MSERHTPAATELDAECECGSCRYARMIPTTPERHHCLCHGCFASRVDGNSVRHETFTGLVLHIVKPAECKADEHARIHKARAALAQARGES